MGFDKQLIEIQGEILPIYLGEKLKKHFEEIIIVTYRPELYKDADFFIVEDIYKHKGPMAGLHAGLKNMRKDSEGAFLVACDMPFLNDNYIEFLKGKFTKNISGVVSIKDGFIEPMMGIYNKNLIPDIEKRLEKGKNKLRDLIKEKDFLYLKEEFLKEKFKTLDFFENLNYEKDLEILD